MTDGEILSCFQVENMTDEEIPLCIQTLRDLMGICKDTRSKKSCERVIKILETHSK